MTEKELRKKNPQYFRQTEKELLTRKAKLKNLTKKQLEDLHAGKIKLPEIPRNARVNFGKNRLVLKRPSAKEIERRKCFVAGLIRKRVALVKIKRMFVERYKVSVQTAQKYIRKTYDEFRDQYTPEARNEMMSEHLEFLKEASRRALLDGDYTGVEKLARQYAECIKFINPEGFKNLVIAPDNRQLINVTDQRTAEITLKQLEDLSTNDFLERIIGQRPIKEIREPVSRPALGCISGEAEMQPCGTPSHDNEGAEA